ncbi:hypothetical protein WICMUC_003588 [Wickerhamomyces mucosus]|uniref:DNA mismatch repair protein n=1 Tax=Wickerhamomyces mucosus TaxID=1378264 RepID=A0A9P8TC10_9ASCO|nr:hypothetical protein WICMUC_003588 [Wickerhamomyces mucosus]
MVKLKSESPTAVRNAKKAGNSTDTKFKQSSLMSFFSKAPKSSPFKPAQKTSSDKPPSPKSSQTTDITVIEDGDEEDKENDRTLGTEITKNSITPITLSQSVIKRNPLNETKNDLFANKQIPSSPTVSSVSRRGLKKVSYSEMSDEDDHDGEADISITRSQRKRRHIVTNDDSEDEFVLDVEDSKSDDDLDDDFVVPDDFEDDRTKASGEEQEAYDDDDDEFLQLSKKKSKASPSKSTIERTPAKSSVLSKQFSSASKYTPTSKPSSRVSTPQSKGQKFTKENEERYQWLVDIRDAEKRSETDPDYDPRTLYIPSSAWAKFTNFEKQYWEIKSKMWDCIVFFKKGKFYELYEKDAFVAHNQFDLKIAGGGRANMQLAGIPEMSFDYWATSFISKGYKVAKVDQIETGLAKEIRESNGGGKAKKDVIQRELKCVLTAGTLTDESMLIDDMSTYCIAIKEEQDPENINGKIFGVSFIDTATGLINITQFKDDNECTKFETLISQIRPKELIVSRNNLSPLATKIIKFNSQNNAIFNTIKPDTEFYDADTTFEQLTRSNYFKAQNVDDLSNWPKILKEYHEQNKTVGFSAFGGLLWYLRSLKLDESLISLGNISSYTTIKPATNLVLDGQTLQNLEIFANSFDGTDKGTLFRLINRATTPFGKRLMKTWVVHPLLKRDDIELRLDSVDQLLQEGEIKELIESKLAGLPDLERLLSRIHAGQLKLKDFTRVIEGFEEILSLYKRLGDFELKGFLGKLYEKFPVEFKEALDKWSDAFDRLVAKEQDMLILNKGVEDDYDESKAVIEDLEAELNTKLREYRKQFKTQAIEYKDSGKELYTIEISNSIKVPNTWKMMGSNKKTKRYWSPEVEELSKRYARAKETHNILEDSLKTRMLLRFDQDYDTWTKVISIISKIDCTNSLAKTSESIGYPSVRPEFIESEIGELTFKELRHPCFNMGVSSSKDFIPNDIGLGGDNSSNIGLLTGANAAGKSTVLRMTCIAVILAQIGCFVPCQYARLTPIDRIMTRLGANDNIMQGKSTFFVELSETKKILENATPKSLLVIDELGRGGSSSDGFAIAEAVLHHISTHIQSLGFFATHYGSLYSSFKDHPQIKPLRMSILVDKESKKITFLYKLEEGLSEGSFGMNVARMCGISNEIITQSEIAAESFEFTSKSRKNDIVIEEIPLGLQSDISRLIKSGLSNKSDGIADGVLIYNETVQRSSLKSIFTIIDGL